MWAKKPYAVTHRVLGLGFRGFEGGGFNGVRASGLRTNVQGKQGQNGAPEEKGANMEPTMKPAWCPEQQ